MIRSFQVLLKKKQSEMKNNQNGKDVGLGQGLSRLRSNFLLLFYYFFIIDFVCLPFVILIGFVNKKIKQEFVTYS